MSETTAKRGRSSTVIATRVNWLGNRLVTTASATYGQIGLGDQVSLTDQGKVLWHQIEKISDEREVRLLRGFTEEEAEQVLNYLSRMLDNMAEVALLAEQVQELIGGRAPEAVG